MTAGRCGSCLPDKRHRGFERGDVQVKISADVFRLCPANFTCIRAQRNPDFGYTSYDSFGWALLSSFRLLAQADWDHLLRLVRTRPVPGRPPLRRTGVLVTAAIVCVCVGR